MANFVALFDANIFYPATLRDLMLRVAMSDAFRARWSDDIHDEWMRAVLRERPELSERLKRTRELINNAVPDCLVYNYMAHIENIRLPDPNDRHVLAAAIQCQAGVIVTMNTKDFPDAVLHAFGMQAQHPDQFLTHLHDLQPACLIQAVQGMRRSLKNPPLTVEQLLDALLRVKLPNTVSILKDFKDML
jgi:predicted nucleic acid-binding protein